MDQILVNDSTYLVTYDPVKSKIVIDVPNGKATISHKKLTILFTYKRTQESIVFTISNKGVIYEDDKRINEREAQNEFKRLLGPMNGNIAWEEAKSRLLWS